MAMPADAINAILTGTPSPTHLWVMNETSGTTFADQVVSGNKPLTAGTGCVPNGWGTLGGKREIGGPLTPAPTFDGTTNASASASGATIGGLAPGWGIVMWIDSTLTSLIGKTLYCERGSSGNDVILWFINASQGLTLTVCDDTIGNSKSVANPSTGGAIRGGKGQFNAGGQFLGVSVAADGTINYFLNGPFGVGSASVKLSLSHTWTNAGVTTNIGFDPLAAEAPFNGTIAWAATFNQPFTAAQFNTWYQALTPQPTHGQNWTQAGNGAVYPNSQFWTQKLPDTAPVDPNSSAIITQWLAIAGAKGFSPTVPMFSLDATGRSGTGTRTFFQSVDQHALLLGMPTPDTLATSDPYPANLNSDGLAWVCEPSTGRQFDMYQGITAGVGALPSVLAPPSIGTPTVIAGTGTLAVGAYFYSISAINSNGESFAQADVKATVNSIGEVTLPLTVELSGTPAPTAWKIWRRGPYPVGGPFGTTADYQVLTTTTGTPSSFTDAGSFTPSAGTRLVLSGGSSSVPYGTMGTARTSDWLSFGGGASWDYLKNAAFNPNLKPSGATNNGESATSRPAGAGTVTIEEALNGVIPHPICVAMPSSNNSQAIQGHRWPAPRHDGVYNSVGHPTLEGMRLRLPVGFDENTVTYNAYAPLATLQRAIVVAMRDYGLVICDSTVGAMLMYAEDAPQTGRDCWSYIWGGLSGGSTAVASVLDPMPWSSLQVLMPFRYANRTDVKGRRTNRLDVAGFQTHVPY